MQILLIEHDLGDWRLGVADRLAPFLDADSREVDHICNAGGVIRLRGEIGYLASGVTSLFVRPTLTRKFVTATFSLCISPNGE